MNFKLVKGIPERIPDYCKVFFDSKLYDAYFSEEGVLPALLGKAIASGCLYVAMSSQDEPVGVMYMTMDGMAGLPYLNLLGVRKKYRGMGIGSELLRIFIGTAEAQGYPNMFIMTSKFNVRAKNLYQSMGFRPQCLLPDVMHKGVSEWLFMRPASNRGW